jgi:hypothetical protein
MPPMATPVPIPTAALVLSDDEFGAEMVLAFAVNLVLVLQVAVEEALMVVLAGIAGNPFMLWLRSACGGGARKVSFVEIEESCSAHTHKPVVTLK